MNQRTSGSVNSPNSKDDEMGKKVKDLESKREIGRLGSWSVTSCKSGFGVEQIRDDNLDTYWQSDGTLPHSVNVQFGKRMEISHVFFYVDIRKDESYCPNKVSLKVGSNFYDLQEVMQLVLEEPKGWQEFDLTTFSEPVHAHYIQITVLENHQSGKDCHLRQVKVFSPRSSFLQEPDELVMSSQEFRNYTILR